MIKRVLTLSLALALVFLCVLPAIAESTATVMYVYTDNRKGLNVRSTPYVGENIIGLAPFGSAVTVKRFMDNGWACIQWTPTMEAYVQSRFLQWTRPSSVTAAPYTPTPTPTPVPVVTVAPYLNPYNSNNYNNYNNNYNNYNNYGYNNNTYTDTMAVLNAEFRTARLVSPSFVIVVRPTRASGWVNMRWAPSKDAEIIANYRSGAKLTVIAETQSWYQVIDPNTEATGFMMKTYTTRQY